MCTIFKIGHKVVLFIGEKCTIAYLRQLFRPCFFYLKCMFIFKTKGINITIQYNILYTYNCNIIIMLLTIKSAILHITSITN